MLKEYEGVPGVGVRRGGGDRGGRDAGKVMRSSLNAHLASRLFCDVLVINRWRHQRSTSRAKPIGRI